MTGVQAPSEFGKVLSLPLHWIWLDLAHFLPHRSRIYPTDTRHLFPTTTDDSTTPLMIALPTLPITQASVATDTLRPSVFPVSSQLGILLIPQINQLASVSLSQAAGYLLGGDPTWPGNRGVVSRHQCSI